jgi:hypothetical protein
VPDDVEPAELARLLDFAERPRVHDWSLRAALVRYAQPQPERAAQIVELVRRIGAALRARHDVFERDGPTVWTQLTGSEASNGAGASPEVIGVLEAAAEMERLGDRLATWAVDRTGQRPDHDVDEVVADVTRRLDALGVPREERERPPRSRG